MFIHLFPENANVFGDLYPLPICFFWKIWTYPVPINLLSLYIGAQIVEEVVRLQTAYYIKILRPLKILQL